MRTAADQNSLLIQQTFPLSTQNYKFSFTETTNLRSEFQRSDIWVYCVNSGKVRY